jgi:hypothetical protein
MGRSTIAARTGGARQARPRPFRAGPRALALAVGLLALTGCGGEVEVERLAVRPSLEAWQNDIQPLFRDMGCSVPGACHGDDFRGEVRIIAEPDANQSYNDYLSVKAALNLGDAEASPLLVRLLRNGPGGNHFPPCFNGRDACAWRKVVAWIEDDGTGPGPEAIDCDASGEFCRP